MQAWGGPLNGKVANHVIPDAMLNNQLGEFAPYRTPGDHGSLEKAKAAMKGSKYDTKGDGTCSAAACKNVLMITDTGQLEQARPRRAGQRQEARDHVHRAHGRGCVSDDPDDLEEHPDRGVPRLGQGLRGPADLLRAAVRRPHDHPERQHELLARRDHAAADARSSGSRATVSGIPSVDADLDRCKALVGPPRLTCYAGVDRTLMTKVVPGSRTCGARSRTSRARR